jgi:hypothetical protein
MIGTTLHTVSRILSGWDSKGLVEGGDKDCLFAISAVYQH